MCVGVLRGCPMRPERRAQRRGRAHRAAPKIAELRLRICAFFVHMVRRLRCVGCVSDFEMTVNFRRVTTHIFWDSHRSARPVYLSFLFASFARRLHKIHSDFLGCDCRDFSLSALFTYAEERIYFGVVWSFD